MSEQKIIISQLQSDGSYLDYLPKADAWTKNETISSQTATTLGLSSNYKPDDAFLSLYFGSGTYGYRVRVLFDDGKPCSGCVVSGLTQITGLSLTTDDDGYVLGKSTSTSVTVSITVPYLDWKKPSSQTVTSTGIVTDIVFTLEKVTDMLTFTSSITSKISSYVKTIDATIVGGGGAGSTNSSSWNSGGGGGGGYVTTLLSKEISNGTIKVTIGTGGVGGYNYSTRGTRGTTQLFINDELLISASGRKGAEYATGGTGNGNGGSGSSYTSGGSSSGYIFNDTSLGLAGGGGGGAGQSSSNLSGSFPIYGKSGGSPNGGQGGNVTNNSSGTNGVAGSIMGGGGGGSATWYKSGFNNSAGASRASGGAYLRFHF